MQIRGSRGAQSSESLMQCLGHGVGKLGFDSLRDCGDTVSASSSLDRGHHTHARSPKDSRRDEEQSMTKDKRKVKPSTGHSPAIMGKGAAHRDRTKYTRKRKHDKRQEQDQD